ncbi:hypothetical protein BGZ63DRAFT_434049 [Mariannaea sp. PMI_226]|nr:hypothetical protein BGZ63DRAFT_434049 [Mariannaea sp. PMI_226]
MINLQNLKQFFRNSRFDEVKRRLSKDTMLIVNPDALSEGVHALGMQHFRSAATVEHWFKILEHCLGHTSQALIVVNMTFIEKAVEYKENEDDLFKLSDFVQITVELIQCRERGGLKYLLSPGDLMGILFQSQMEYLGKNRSLQVEAEGLRNTYEVTSKAQAAGNSSEQHLLPSLGFAGSLNYVIEKQFGCSVLNQPSESAHFAGFLLDTIELLEKQVEFFRAPDEESLSETKPKEQEEEEEKQPRSRILHKIFHSNDMHEHYGMIHEDEPTYDRVAQFQLFGEKYNEDRTHEISAPYNSIFHHRKQIAPLAEDSDTYKAVLAPLLDFLNADSTFYPLGRLAYYHMQPLATAKTFS